MLNETPTAINLNINKGKSIQLVELHIQSESTQNEKGTSNLQQLKYLTPWDDMKHEYLIGDVVNFQNKQIEINFLDQHPTESSY